MNKAEILEAYRKQYHCYSDYYREIDQPIKPLVNYLRKLGFITYSSCSSHVTKWDKTPSECSIAFVAFFYADEDKHKVEELFSHNFPKSKHYEIVRNYHSLWPNRAEFTIYFMTTKNRTKYLKEIYKSLGIECGRLRLPPQRKCVGDVNFDKSFPLYRPEMLKGWRKVQMGSKQFDSPILYDPKIERIYENKDQ